MFHELEINNGFDLLFFLKNKINVGDNFSWWQPSEYSYLVLNGIELKGFKYNHFPLFSHLISAILFQNTKYENASKAINNLFSHSILQKCDGDFTELDLMRCNEINLNNIANLDPKFLSKLIYSAGFYNQKSVRIVNLCINIKKEFRNFQSFSENASLEWILSQKGIGLESALSILNYALKKEYLVFDSYTRKFLSNFGYEFLEYESFVSFFAMDIKKISLLYEFDISLSQVYARLHGKIVEICKKYK